MTVYVFQPCQINLKIIVATMIFGLIASTDPVATIIVLVVTLIVLYFLGVFLSKLKIRAEIKRYGQLFEKIERELLQLGLISFGLFLFNPANYGDSDKDLTYKEAFDFTHILILFIAIAFILQSSIMLHFSNSADKTFLIAINSDAETLFHKYNEMQQKGNSWESYMFHKSPLFASSLNSLRTHIEFKIIKRLFLDTHKLPIEFSFSKYSMHLFKVFISEIGDMNVFSWSLLILLCLLNFLRVEIIDPAITSVVCRGASDHLECVLYLTLCYACMMMLFLSIYVFVIYHVTCAYFDMLVHRSLSIDGIDFNQTGRFGYKRALEAMMTEENKKDEESSHILQFSEANNNHESGQRPPQSYSLSDSSTSGPMSYRELARTMHDVKDKHNESLSRAEQRRAVEASNHQSICNKFSHCIETLSEPFDDSHLEIRDLFWRQSPWLYFRAVEVSLFLQCLYLALWACQLMPLVHLSERSVGLAGLWIVVLTIPIIINLLLANQTVNKAVLIRSVCGLDREIVGVVCDEIVQEGRAISDLRIRIRTNLERGQIPLDKWKPFIQQLFMKYDKDRSGTLNKAEFRLLLEDIEIFLGSSAFSLIWELIDCDHSNCITWDELFLILFPELKKEIKSNLEIAKKLRKEIELRNNLPPLRSPDNLKHLRLRFDMVDKDKSGLIEKHEFKELLESLHVKISDRNLNVLMATLDTEESDGCLSWEEFVDLIYPPVIAPAVTIRVAKDSKTAKKEEKPTKQPPKAPGSVFTAPKLTTRPDDTRSAPVSIGQDSSISANKAQKIENAILIPLKSPPPAAAEAKSTDEQNVRPQLPPPPTTPISKPVKKPKPQSIKIDSAGLDAEIDVSSPVKFMQSPQQDESGRNSVSPSLKMLDPNTVVLQIPKGLKEIGIAVIDDHKEELDGVIVAHIRIIAFRNAPQKLSIASTNAGFRLDDVIYEVNGKTFPTYEELVHAIYEELQSNEILVFKLSERGEPINWTQFSLKQANSARSKHSTRLHKLSVALNKKINMKALL